MTTKPPMKHESKFNHQEPQQSEELKQAAENQMERTFTSVEELIRHDATQVIPPASILTRLKDSLSQQRKNSWWHRWFSP